MNTYFLPTLLAFYGCFLISCGIISVVFIGMKAKTALASGGTMGMISLVLAYLSSPLNLPLAIASMIFTLCLFFIFSWRTSKTLFTLFELIQAKDPFLKGKGIAFLIISLMAVISLVVTLLQLLLLVN